MEIRSFVSWLRPRSADDRPAPTAPRAAQAPSEDGSRDDSLAELRARREELVRMEDKALREAESVRTQLREIERRREALDDRERNLELRARELKEEKRRQVRELERIAGL